ncbi:hypothetical protein [Modestobacter sp. KNN46-3]|uniref:hypothetical protein n=1 Tax=Modestobacter sp. KNN46-3 TaxID=2711218 RepID=UPI0013E02AC4|nr:hypothetical protein [Modestobacter sp. KNN46-3]
MKLTDSCRCGAELTVEHDWVPHVHEVHTRWLEHHTDCEFAPPTPDNITLGGDFERAEPFGFAATIVS